MRTISTIVMVILAIYTVFFANPIFGVALMAGLSYATCFELLKVTKNEFIQKFTHIFCIFSALTPIHIYYNISFYNLLIAIIAFFIITLYLTKFEKINIKDVAIIICATFILPQILNSITHLYLLENGKFFLILPIICASITDIFAFLVGKTIGKHKLSPKISPNKTIEGAIGGVIACVITTIIYCYFTYEILAISALTATAIGILGACFGIVGDLFFSMIKRQSNLKDFSQIIPGHGGVLDRFDSIIFTSFITYTILSII